VPGREPEAKGDRREPRIFLLHAAPGSRKSGMAL
jgi:hypothetical protein